MRSFLAPADHPVARWFARIVLALLALIGALPLFVSLALRSPAVQLRLQEEARAAMMRELGVACSLRAELTLLPPEIVLRDVVIPANDGPVPALTAIRARVRPKLFSLLSGRIDAGEVTVEAPKVRVIVDGTGVKNVTYRLPPSKGPSKGPLLCCTTR